MKKYLFFAFAILLVWGIAACSPAAPVPEQLTPTVESGTAGSYHALTIETGIQTIDQVLAAVASGDPRNALSVIEFFEAECTLQEGLGGPPRCREEEAEGTPVEVLAFIGAEGGHLRRDELEDGLAVRATGVYAVYEVNTAVLSSEQYYPVGNYVILLMGEENEPATALRIGESGIVRVDTIFDTSPANLNAMIEREALNVIVAPKS